MRDARRRNRNIGTAKSGWKRQSDFCKPISFAELEKEYEKCERFLGMVHGYETTVFIDPLNDNFIHACTPEDVLNLLRALPEEDCSLIHYIHLRQPTRKANIFTPSWGSIRYYGGPDYLPIISLDAQYCPLFLRMKNSITPFLKKELKCYRECSKNYSHDKRHHRFEMDQEGIRKFQLSRTLPHEIGHWVDFHKLEIDRNISSDQKEQRANEYADRMYDRIKGVVELALSKDK